MLKRLSIYTIFVLGFAVLFAAGPAKAQIGNSGSIDGVVKDPSGGVVANAAVEISNPVSGFKRVTATGNDGSFHFSNIPFNPYHLVVTAAGFNSYTQDVDVRSTVPTTLQISLKLGTDVQTVRVEANGGDLVENDSTYHTDVDQAVTDRMPLGSTTSGVSSLTACSMGWETTRKTRFLWTTSRSRINRARFFLTNFPRIRFSRWK
jgi:hypothetical protein